LKQIKWLFLVLAVIAASCMIGVGIAVAQRSMIGIISFIVATVACFGIGFTLKSKLLKN
jgi:hypothetical protein